MESRDPHSTAARSCVHQLFALAYRHPRPAAFERLADGSHAAALCGAVASVPHLGPARPLAEALLRAPPSLRAGGFEAYAAAFAAVFEDGVPEPPCPLHEGRYRPRLRRSALLLDLHELYRQFEVSPGADAGRPLLPDHLSPELSLLSYLCFGEARAAADGDAEGAEGFLRAERDLLEGHLCRWVPELAARVERAATVPWIASLTRLLASAIEEEWRHVAGVVAALEREHEWEEGEGGADLEGAATGEHRVQDRPAAPPPRPALVSLERKR